MTQPVNSAPEMTPSSMRARVFRYVAPLLTGIFGLVSPHLAHAANAADLTVTVDVKPFNNVTQVSTVSVSRTGLAAYVAYKVKLVNFSTNTVNQVVFTGTTRVNEPVAVTDIAGYAAFVNLGSADPNCPAPPAPTTPPTSNVVTCKIGQLKSQESREFFLLFRTPTSGTSVSFNGHTNFSEGNSSNTPPASFTENVDLSSVLTTTQTQDINSSVITVLPPRGGKFFTGQQALVGSGNPFSTSVDVTPSFIVTDNAVKQTVDGATSACVPNIDATYFCYGLNSAIAINNAQSGLKAYFDDLAVAPARTVVTMIFRQDASSLVMKKPVPAIAKIRIFYTPDSATPQLEIFDCTITNTVSRDHPCISGRIDQFKGSKGYYEYQIQAVDNGKFSM